MAEPMSKFIVVPVNKEMIAILRWVKLATSRDESSPMLQSVLFTPEAWVATDGFRIHEANISGLPVNTFPTDGAYLVRSIHGGLVVLEKADNTFADYRPVLAAARSGGVKPEAAAERYSIRFSIQAKFLVDALSFNGNATSYKYDVFNVVEMNGGPLVISVGCDIEGVKLTACVMPMELKKGPRRLNAQTVILKPVLGEPA